MSNQVQGVAPGLLLVPAREHKWEVQAEVKITLPKPEESLLENGFCELWKIVPALFVAHKYPDLADDQCLNITALEEGENGITLYGQLLKVL
jgi:hypothetical protein